MDQLVNLIILALFFYGVYWFIQRAKKGVEAGNARRNDQRTDFGGNVEFNRGEPVLVAQACPYLGPAIDGLRFNQLAVGMRGTVVAVHRSPTKVPGKYFKQSNGYDIIFGGDTVRVEFGFQHLLVRPLA